MLRSEIELQDSRFTERDVAWVVGPREMAPLNLQVEYDVVAQTICASLTPESNVSYVPIALRPDWETALPERFTAAELGLLITDLVAYILLLLFLLARVAPLIIHRHFPFGAGVSIPLGLLYSTRILYYCLILGGALYTDDAGLGTFVLVELPLLLMLNSAIYFIVNFVYITRMVSKLMAKSQAQVRPPRDPTQLTWQRVKSCQVKATHPPLTPASGLA